MSTQNKNITNIRLKGNKIPKKVAPDNILLGNNGMSALEERMLQIHKRSTVISYSYKFRWKFLEIFNTKKKWDDFLKQSLKDNGIFNRRESEDLIIKYDERPLVPLNKKDSSFTNNINFRVWRKSDRKATMYDIDAQLEVQHSTDNDDLMTMILTYKNATKVTDEMLIEEKENSKKIKMDPKRQLPERTIQKIAELDKHFANNQGALTIDSGNHLKPYIASDAIKALTMWLNKEVFVNKDASIKVELAGDRGSYKQKDKDKEVYKYIAYQLHQKRKTERIIQLTFEIDHNARFNKHRDHYYKTGIFTITGWSKEL